jgi:hypothetical protein
MTREIKTSPETCKAVLDLELPEDSDFGAVTIRQAMLMLAGQIWREGEEFSGKRPLGNSDWQSQVTDVVIAAGLSEDDWQEAERVVSDAISYMTWKE